MEIPVRDVHHVKNIAHVVGLDLEIRVTTSRKRNAALSLSLTLTLVAGASVIVFGGVVVLAVSYYFGVVCCDLESDGAAQL